MNFYFEMLGGYFTGQSIQPKLNNASFLISVLEQEERCSKIGYSMTIQKAGVKRVRLILRQHIDPRLNYNYKFIENMEKHQQLRFYRRIPKIFSEPIEDMHLAFKNRKGKNKNWVTVTAI
jgi:hypothetical protein